MPDIDSLSIQIEASSDEATKRVNELANALKKLQSATTGKFGNVDEQISNIGQTSSAATRITKRKQAFYDATKQPKSKTSAKDVFPGTEEISKAIDSARQKYDEFIQYVEKNSGKITRDVASDVSRKISAEQENLQKILDGIESGIGQTPKESADLYAAADALQSAQEKIRQIWGKPAPQIINVKSIQAATDSAAKFQEALETPSLGTADEFLKANSQIDILQRKAESLKVSLDEALGKGDQAKADKLTEQYRRVTSQIEKLGQESEKTASKVNDLKNAYKSATNPISKFTKTLGRIAYYRMIRSAIRAVTDGIKTGMDNLYEYSRITGTEFKPAMDSLATSSLYLKNSLGALIGPIVQSLAPAVEFLTDRFVDLINVFNQFISALSGKDVYTAAKKHAVEYKEATDAAAKSTKKFLLGIDELNIMDAPSGGAGGASTAYGDMFEEKPIEGNIKELANNLKPILEIVGEIALGFAAWQLTKGFLGDLENTSGLVKGLKAAAVLTVQFALSKWTMDNLLNSTEIGDQIKWGIGNILTQGLAGYATYKLLGNKGILLSTAVGFAANLSSLILGIKEGGLSIDKDPQTWISAGLTTALGGIGGGIFLDKTFAWGGTGFLASTAISLSLVLAGINYAQIASGQWKADGAESFATSIASIAAASIGGAVLGNLIAPGVGAVAGAAIGFGVGLVINLVSISMGEQVAYENSEFHKEMEAIREKAAEVMEVNKQINLNIETRYKNLDSVKADFAAMRKILDDMFVLADKPAKTVAEIETLKAYVDTVNSWNLEGVKVEWDELNQLVIADKDAIYEVIDALEKQALATAAQEMLVDAYKDLIRETENANTAVLEYNKANDALVKLQSEKNDLMSEYSDLAKGATESDAAYADRITDSSARVYEYGKKMSDMNRKIEDAESALKDAKKAVKDSADTMSSVENQIDQFGEIMSGNAKIGMDAFSDLKTSADDLYKVIDEKDWVNLGGNISGGIAKGISGSANKIATATKNALDDALKAAQKHEKINSPSKVWRDNVGLYIGEGIGVGIEKSAFFISESVNGVIDKSMPNLRGIKRNSKEFSSQAPALAGQIVGTELVNKIGNRNAGANNDQIVQGISAGVEDANIGVINAVMAIGQQIVQAVNNKDTNLYMDGKKVSREMQRYNVQAERNRGGSLVRVGG